MSSLNGTYSYYQDRTNTQSHGQITFSDKAVGYLPEELSENDLFEHIIQECRYYNGTIYHHKSQETPGWDYHHPEGNHAPDETLIKPFLWQVRNVGCGTKVSISLMNNLDHISLSANLMVDRDVARTQAGEIISDSYAVVKNAIEETGREMLNFNAIGIMQMLSHFINKNIFGSTRRVFIDDVQILPQCNINRITPDSCTYTELILDSEGEPILDTDGQPFYIVKHVECPTEDEDGNPIFMHCINGECVEAPLCPGQCWYGFMWDWETHKCLPITCPPGTRRIPDTQIGRPPICVGDYMCPIGTKPNPEWNPDPDVINTVPRCIEDECEDGKYWNSLTEQCETIPPITCPEPFDLKPRDKADVCGFGTVYNWDDTTCKWREDTTTEPPCGLRLVRDPVTCLCVSDPCLPPDTRPGAAGRNNGCPTGTKWAPAVCACVPDDWKPTFDNCTNADSYEVSVNFYYCQQGGHMAQGGRPCRGGHTCNEAIFNASLTTVSVVLDEKVINLNNGSITQNPPPSAIFGTDRPGGTLTGIIPPGPNNRIFFVKFECALNYCHSDITTAHVVVRRIRLDNDGNPLPGHGDLIGWFENVDAGPDLFMRTIPCE